MTPNRAPVAFIAWAAVDGRSKEIAHALGGEARCFFDFRIAWRPLIPLRYFISALRTLEYLIRRRPAAVIATNPPVFPGMIALAYGRLARAPVVLDSHPSAFGLGERIWRLLLPLHRFMVKRATATLVTGEALSATVRAWEGRPVVVHEAPLQWDASPAPALSQRPRVLFICIFAPDEPVSAVIEAAGLLPQIDLYVTGDERLCPLSIRSSASTNVTFTGFLRGDAYRAALSRAHIVLALTDRAEAVNRAAYEAIYALRPLVLSDSPAQRGLFPHAVHVGNDAASVADGISQALVEYDRLAVAAFEARELQMSRWDAQLQQLRQAVALPGARPARPAAEGLVS